MNELLAQRWFVLLSRGILAMIMGLLAFSFSAFNIKTLSMIFGSYIIFDAFLLLASSFFVYNHSIKTLILIESIGGLIAGILILIWPKISVALFLVLFTMWALVSGTFKVIGFFRINPVIGEWLYVVIGIFSLFFGVLLLFFPNLDLVFLMWGIGVYLSVVGALFLIFSFTSPGSPHLRFPFE